MSEKIIISPEEFNALSREQKKVLVAQDILDQLEVKKYTASRGSYVNMYNVNADKVESSAREQLIDGSIHCEVCARGALFLSSVRYKNKINLLDARRAIFYYNDEPDLGRISATDFMEDVFTKQEQGIMEAIFENSVRYIVSGYDFELDGCAYEDEDINGNPYPTEFIELRDKFHNYYDKIVDDYAKRDDENERRDEFVLKAMMQNIIDNNGTLTL